jgi:bla regulator protein BlaR1
MDAKLGRMMLDILYVSRLRKYEVYEPGDDWKIKLLSLSHDMGIRKKVSLLQSAQINIPIVVGHLKPVILVPVGVLAGLPAADVEAVLLHELAHIRRHDYLVNFIQRIAEMLLFFNPALLWISSLLRIERENCCDDIAIEKTKDKTQFVEALISFKEHSLRHPRYAIGLFGKRNLLLQRVSRIVHNRNKTLSPFEGVFFVMNLFIFVVLVSVLRKPVTSEPLSSLPHGPHVEQALYFPTQSINERQPASGKKPLLTNKDIKPSSGPRLGKSTIKIKEPVLPEPNFDTQKEVIEETSQLYASTYQRDQQSMLRTDINLSQIEKDRQAAEADRKQAEIDRQQADKDRHQADRDREQANADRKQAEKDRERADQDRKQADKDRELAETARTQVVKHNY